MDQTMIEKLEFMNELFDIYGGLLTKKQQQILEQYYREDFSLREIAENLGVSHNAVRDHLKRSELLLTTYENNLQILKNRKKRSEIYDKIAMLEIEEVFALLEQLKKTEM